MAHEWLWAFGYKHEARPVHRRPLPSGARQPCCQTVAMRSIKCDMYDAEPLSLTLCNCVQICHPASATRCAAAAGAMAGAAMRRRRLSPCADRTCMPAIAL